MPSPRVGSEASNKTPDKKRHHRGRCQFWRDARDSSAWALTSSLMRGEQTKARSQVGPRGPGPMSEAATEAQSGSESTLDLFSGDAAPSRSLLRKLLKHR